MKYAVTILSALLAAVAAVLLAVRGLDLLDTGSSLLFVSMIALVVLAVIQFFKTTPRILLMFCGLGASLAVGAFAQGWLPALLMLAAAVMPAVYVLTGWARQVKAEPLRPEKNKILIAAGVMASIYAVYQVVAGVLTAGSAEDWLGSGLAGTAGLAVFCFLNRRKTSVFYRLMFFGMGGLGFTLPYDDMAAQLVGWLTSLLKLFSVLLVLDDAIRMRHELSGTTSKHESDRGTMIYALTALLSLPAVWMIYTPVPPLYNGSGYLLAFTAMLFILSVVQFFKTTPRLLLMTAGTVMMLSLGSIASGDFGSLLPLAAGVLPTVYLLIRFGKQARNVTLVRKPRLVAAGVLAGMFAVGLLLTLFAGYPFVGLAVLPQALFAAGLAVFCLIRTQPDGVLYRLMFAGWPWMLPALADSLGTAADFSGGLLALGALLVLIICLMLVYSEAVNTKGELESVGNDVGAEERTSCSR